MSLRKKYSREIKNNISNFIIMSQRRTQQKKAKLNLLARKYEKNIILAKIMNE
jgi:hypothetical protein